MQDENLQIKFLQFCLFYSLSVSLRMFFSLSPHKTYKKLQIKSTGKEEVLSRKQVPYLSHLDMCQLNNPQPSLGKNYWNVTQYVGWSSRKQLPSSTGSRKKGQLAVLPQRQGATKHRSAKGRRKQLELKKSIQSV